MLRQKIHQVKPTLATVGISFLFLFLLLIPACDSGNGDRGEDRPSDAAEAARPAAQGDGPALPDRPSSADEAASSSGEPGAAAPNRLRLYRKAFASMDLERFRDLVDVDEDGISHYRQIEDASSEMDHLLNTLELLTEAAFAEDPLDWEIDFGNFPRIESGHWRSVQHGGLIVQWWVQKLIDTGEIEMSSRILAIGLKVAGDVASDRTLQGSILALTIRDELCQVVAENVYRLTPQESWMYHQSLLPYHDGETSWVAESFPYAVAEKEWFIGEALRIRARGTSALASPDSLDKDFVTGFYALNGFEAPLDRAILKGVPASTLVEDPDKAMELVNSIIEEVSLGNLRQFIGYSDQDTRAVIDRITRIHKDLGVALKLSDWNGYAEATRSMMRNIESTPFVWNHATAWMKARKSEFMSRLKYSLAIAGLAWHAGNTEAARSVVNPINGSSFSFQAFRDGGKEKGYFVFVRDFDRVTFDSFSPFHQMLFITDAVDRYHPYGLMIGHRID